MSRWEPYQRMVEDAHRMGGPDIYKRHLVESGIEIGIETGKESTRPWIGAMLGVGVLAGIGVTKGVEYLIELKRRKGCAEKKGIDDRFKKPCRKKLRLRKRGNVIGN